MALDPRVQRLLAMLSIGGEASAPSEDVSARRRAFAEMMSLTGLQPAADVDHSDIIVPGPGGELLLRHYVPRSTRSVLSPAIVYLHGGGWITGGLETHDGLCSRLAEASHCRVLAVDYRLAPENQHPAGLYDAVAATRWIIDNAMSLEIDPSRVVIAGDSAGANLAASLCRLFAQQGASPFVLQLLLYPFLDLVADTPSRRAYGRGYFLDVAAMKADLALCLPADADLTDPILSPLRSDDFSGLPAAHIHTAEYDPMCDEGEIYASRLAAAGVETRYTRHAGMIHQFLAMGGAIPYAAPALREIGAAVAEALAARRGVDPAH
ncbi:alpha/beta hydrolase [Rhodoblastus sp.]|uniref:alpha/beta hydrolase n=1 Tax=Rhodoblastus sp. TaxID=1962975 RepID=UPI003F9809C9